MLARGFPGGRGGWLARLALGLGGDGAGVTMMVFCKAVAWPRITSLRRCFQAGSEGEDLDGHARNPPARSAAEGGGDRPVISTWPSARHSISSMPPSTTTSAAPPGQPRRAAFTTAAHAPEPQANVSPASRSHNPQPDTIARQHLHEADIGRAPGKMRRCSRRGPPSASIGKRHDIFDERR